MFLLQPLSLLCFIDNVIGRENCIDNVIGRDFMETSFSKISSFQIRLVLHGEMGCV